MFRKKTDFAIKREKSVFFVPIVQSAQEFIFLCGLILYLCIKNRENPNNKINSMKKNLLKPLLLVLFVLLGVNVVFAQNPIMVQGTVVDASTGETLPFVTIRIKGSTGGAVTTPEGTFKMVVPTDVNILIFSLMGYETLEFEIPTGGETMDVKMRVSATTLEGVVITGYQTIARERVTGSVSMVSADALESRFNQNLMNNLEGRVAGLVVDAHGNATIRGTGTLSAGLDPNSEAGRRMRAPLLVVDGLPVEGRIEDLNPFDIENVTVLKDAAAAAMYGARASNGIIVVTTKKARQSGTTVDVSANYTVFQKRNVDYAANFLLTPAQHIDAENAYWYDHFVETDGAAGNRNTWANNNLTPNRNRAFSPIQYANWQLGQGILTQRQVNALLNELRQNNYAREFADHVLLNHFIQQYNVAIRGRTEKFSQSLVLNLRADNGGIIHHNDNRFNISYRGEYKMSRWLTADFGINTVIQRSNSFSENTASPATDPFSEFAYSRLLNDDGSFVNNSRITRDLHPHHTTLRPMHYNAMQELLYDRTNRDRNSSRYHAQLTFKVIEGLSAQTQFVYEDVRNNRTDYAHADSYLMRTTRNQFTRQRGNTIEYLIPRTWRQTVFKKYQRR